MIKMTTFCAIRCRWYTKDSMKKIVATWPQSPRTKDAGTVALFYAGVLLVMTTAQLFSLEKFIPLLDTFALPGEHGGRFIAILLVVCGVFALPFLLRMKLSTGMRWFSMIVGWIVPAVWIFLSVWVNVTYAPVVNAGFLGASIMLEPGWWMVFVSVALVLLAAWSAWGLWPGKHTVSLENNG